MRRIKKGYKLIAFELSLELEHRAKIAAAALGISVSEVCRRGLEIYLQQQALAIFQEAQKVGNGGEVK